MRTELKKTRFLGLGRERFDDVRRRGRSVRPGLGTVLAMSTSSWRPPLAVLIGVDWGGTKIEAAALAPDGSELVRLRTDTPRSDYAACLATVVRLVEQVEATVGPGPVGCRAARVARPAHGRREGLQLDLAHRSAPGGRPPHRARAGGADRERRRLLRRVGGARRGRGGAPRGLRGHPRHRGRRGHRRRRAGARRTQPLGGGVGPQRPALRAPVRGPRPRLLLRPPRLPGAVGVRPRAGPRLPRARRDRPRRPAGGDCRGRGAAGAGRRPAGPDGLRPLPGPAGPGPVAGGERARPGRLRPGRRDVQRRRAVRRAAGAHRRRTRSRRASTHPSCAPRTATRAASGERHGCGDECGHQRGRRRAGRALRLRPRPGPGGRGARAAALPQPVHARGAPQGRRATWSARPTPRSRT